MLLAKIAPRVETINVDTQTVLFRQGDIADCCYLLCSGQVDVTITKVQSQSESIATVESGELLGEMALFANAVRNATVTTLTPCQLLVIKRNEFQQLIQHSAICECANVYVNG